MDKELLSQLEDYANMSVSRLAHYLIDNKDEIIALSINRVATVGQSYNNKSYELGIKELEREVQEELADAIFYQHLILTFSKRFEHPKDAD